MGSLRLEFSGLLVGVVRDAFNSDGTWFGRVDVLIDRATSDQHARVLDFIAFCQDWNERARGGGADASEFDRFSDVVSSGRWQTRASEGAAATVVGAPVFFRPSEVSWTTVSWTTR